MVLQVGNWSYNPTYNPCKWSKKNDVTGIITPVSGVVTLLITGREPTMV